MWIALWADTAARKTAKNAIQWEEWKHTKPTEQRSLQNNTSTFRLTLFYSLITETTSFSLFFMASDMTRSRTATSPHVWMLPSHNSDVGSGRKQEVSALLGNSNKQWHCLVRAERITGIKIADFSFLLTVAVFVLMLYQSGKGLCETSRHHCSWTQCKERDFLKEKTDVEMTLNRANVTFVILMNTCLIM